MHYLTTMIALGTLAPRTLWLLAAMINADDDRKLRHHTALRGLITGLALGTATGITAAFVRSTQLDAGLLGAGALVGLLCWKLLVGNHLRAFVAHLALSLTLTSLLVLVTVSSELGLTST
jgi:hypothetical protein